MDEDFWYLVLRVCPLLFSIFLDSSMVEHTAVNRGVVGSSPTRGVTIAEAKIVAIGGVVGAC